MKLRSIFKLLLARLGLKSAPEKTKEPAILQTGETVLSREDSIKMRTKLATDQSDEIVLARRYVLGIRNDYERLRLRRFFRNNPDIIVDAINRRSPQVKRLIRG